MRVVRTTINLAILALETLFRKTVIYRNPAPRQAKARGHGNLVNIAHISEYVNRASQLPRIILSNM
jgi:hypothetical protein